MQFLNIFHKCNETHVLYHIKYILFRIRNEPNLVWQLNQSCGSFLENSLHSELEKLAR